MDEGTRQRGEVLLTETQIEVIVDRAAVKAAKLAAEDAANKAVEILAERAYMQVGKTVVNKLAWLFGIVVMAVGYWLNSKGFMKFPP